MSSTKHWALLTLVLATAGCGEKDRYVLVHGAWMGAWAWDDVKKDLEEKDHDVVTVELPGHGQDATPIAELTLDAYAKRVVEALDADPRPAILVAHSMGGIPISLAAEARPDAIEKLVYVAAYVPKNGQSLFDLAFTDGESLLGVPGNLVFSADQSSASVNPSVLIEAFCADCPSDQAQRLQENSGAEPTMPLGTPAVLSEDNFGRVPKSYVHTREDKAVGYQLQLRMAKTSSCAVAGTLESSHSPMLSRPSALADLL